jgi:acetylornithine/succinyldiaminopimelate/putrescine aminotransferase
MPESLSHTYFTSGKDELVDKGLRSLKVKRTKAEITIGFSHQWFGNISAAARSLSSDEDSSKPFSWFEWPKIPHPAIVGEKASLDQLEKTIEKFGDEKILGVVLELIGEKTAHTFSDSFLSQVKKLLVSHDIPLIYSETVSSYFRNGRSLFYTDSLSTKPNMVLWHTGGQLGHVFVDDKYFVDKPLTLISTWDGDDISAIRAYSNLLATKKIGEEGGIQKIDQAISKIATNYSHFGMGNWHSFQIDDPEKIRNLIEQAESRKIFLSKGFANTVLVCPNCDISSQKLKFLTDNLSELLNG